MAEKDNFGPSAGRMGGFGGRGFGGGTTAEVRMDDRGLDGPRGGGEDGRLYYGGGGMSDLVAEG